MKAMKERVIISLALAFVLLPTFSHAVTIAELQAQLQILMAQLSALQSQTTATAAPQSGAASYASCPNLSRNLSFGSRGSDVTQLQSFLISQGHLAAGNNTGYFGRLTQSAVQSFQKLGSGTIFHRYHFSEIAEYNDTIEHNDNGDRHNYFTDNTV